MTDARDCRPRVFFLFRDSRLRRAAIVDPAGHRGNRYLLYGMPDFQEIGFSVHHNLETPRLSSGLTHIESFLLNKFIDAVGAVGGDFRSIIANRGRINACDVVVSTVDTEGLPLALFKAFNLIRTPVVYISIGLPERLRRFRSDGMKRRYRKMFGAIESMVAYGYREYRILKRWLRSEASDRRVYFLPFGVDEAYFRPLGQRQDTTDILTVGADPHRDFALMMQLAREMPSRSFQVITSRQIGLGFRDVPHNVSVLMDIPISKVRQRMASATLLVLPLKENSYSGATTTLLQAMSMAKPVVISRVGAIEGGYRLTSGVNCMLVEPGNGAQLYSTVNALLETAEHRALLSRNARNTVVGHFTLNHYAHRLRLIVDRTRRKIPRHRMQPQP